MLGQDRTKANDWISLSEVPCVAMTFDDGPHRSNTERLLRFAEDRKIKLTFFVIGENAQRHLSLLKSTVSAGHEIGNHSWSHANLAKLSDHTVREELQKTTDLVFHATGITPKIMRPPYGELSAEQRRWIEATLCRVVYWNVDPLDWQRPGADVIAARLMAGVRSGSIALAHDSVSQTVEAMPRVFDHFLERGFRFCTVSDLLNASIGQGRLRTPN